MNANKLTTAQCLEILELEADEKDRDNVRNAWKKLCRQHHPDRKDDPEEKVQATARMQAVNEAYEALMKRKQFRDPDEENYYSDDDDEDEEDDDDEYDDDHPFGGRKIFFSFGPNGLTFTYGGQTIYARGGPGGPRGGPFGSPFGDFEDVMRLKSEAERQKANEKRREESLEWLRQREEERRREIAWRIENEEALRLKAERKQKERDEARRQIALKREEYERNLKPLVEEERASMERQMAEQMIAKEEIEKRLREDKKAMFEQEKREKAVRAEAEKGTTCTPCPLLSTDPFA